MARAPRDMDVDVAPEADRLEDFPHPRHTVELFGHDDAQRMLADGVRGGRMHHAWLVTGAQGIGKATLAYRFARFALSGPEGRSGDGLLGADPQGMGARQVASLSHPGLLVIRRPYDFKDKRFKASITIDEVRRLREFLGHTSGRGTWRVVIVDQVDELNGNAANALLKSLEEPPPSCVFLLVSSEPGRLLPTIRSRCRELQLRPLDREALDLAARQAFAASDGVTAPSDDDWGRLRMLAGGSVRRMLSLASSDGAALSAQVDRVFTSVGGRLDWGRVHQLADELAAAAAIQKFETFCDLVLDRLGAAIRRAALAGREADGGGSDGWLVPARLASWAELWETIVREKADAQALNLDRRSFVLETIARIDALAAR